MYIHTPKQSKANTEFLLPIVQHITSSSVNCAYATQKQTGKSPSSSWRYTVKGQNAIVRGYNKGNNFIKNNFHKEEGQEDPSHLIFSDAMQC